jgi:hypothetical protein
VRVVDVHGLYARVSHTVFDVPPNRDGVFAWHSVDDPFLCDLVPLGFLAHKYFPFAARLAGPGNNRTNGNSRATAGQFVEPLRPEGDDQFGGGWNSWNIGVKSWEVKREIIRPFDKRSLYICGEAYSDAQGWVEGALQTADIMLEKIGVPSM